ncbi:MAG: hypothetical protein QM490_01405 [Candidatus Gracilibacteria bacterium]
MENFKISFFNDKELIKDYSKKDISNNIIFYSMEELIFELYNSKENTIKIIDKLYEREILLVAQNKDYITPDGYFYNAEDISILDKNFTEKVDDEGNIHYTDTTVTNYRGLEKIINKINDLTYLSIKDTEIYLNNKIEKLYDLLDYLGLKIIAFSGINEPKRQIDLADGVQNIYSFIIDIQDKNKFNKSAIEAIEDNIKVKGFVIKKLKENLLNKILELDEKYGTEGKNIYIKNENKTSNFRLLLILLNLDNKISIKEYSNNKDEFYINIVEYGKENGVFFDKNNGDVFDNGKKIGNIKPSTQEYKLFKYLYENANTLKTYNEINTYINGDFKTIKFPRDYLQDIKNRIKYKSIKKIIKNVQKKGYMIEISN